VRSGPFGGVRVKRRRRGFASRRFGPPRLSSAVFGRFEPLTALGRNDTIKKVDAPRPCPAGVLPGGSFRRMALPGIGTMHRDASLHHPPIQIMPELGAFCRAVGRAYRAGLRRPFTGYCLLQSTAVTDLSVTGESYDPSSGCCPRLVSSRYVDRKVCNLHDDSRLHLDGNWRWRLRFHRPQ